MAETLAGGTRSLLSTAFPRTVLAQTVLAQTVLAQTRQAG
jgi:hypothetical protein